MIALLMGGPRDGQRKETVSRSDIVCPCWDAHGRLGNAVYRRSFTLPNGVVVFDYVSPAADLL